MKNKEVKRLMDEYARIPRTGTHDLDRYEAFRASAPVEEEKPVKRTFNKKMLVGALTCAFVFAIAVPLLVTYLVPGGGAKDESVYESAAPNSSFSPVSDKSAAPEGGATYFDEAEQVANDPYVRIDEAQASMLEDEALSAALGRTVLRIRYDDEDVGYRFILGDNQTVYVYTADVRLYSKQFETSLDREEVVSGTTVRYAENQTSTGYAYDLLFDYGIKEYNAHVETSQRISVPDTVQAVIEADNE